MRILCGMLALGAFVVPWIVWETFGHYAAGRVVLGEVAVVFLLFGWMVAPTMKRRERTPGSPPGPLPRKVADARYVNCLGCQKAFDEGEPKVGITSGGEAGLIDIGACCLDCVAKLREYKADAKKEEEA